MIATALRHQFAAPQALPPSSFPKPAGTAIQNDDWVQQYLELRRRQVRDRQTRIRYLILSHFADKRDADLMRDLAMGRSEQHPAKRMMVLSGLAGFQRTVTWYAAENELL